MAMQRSLGETCSVIDSIGPICDEEHSAAFFLPRVMEDGDILETKHLSFVPEFGSNETSAGSSQSRIGPAMRAVEFKSNASEEIVGSSNDR
jgi:hypothetical protein